MIQVFVYLLLWVFVMKACRLGTIPAVRLDDRNDIQYVKLALSVSQVERKAPILLPVEGINEDLK